jgi:EAL domain-containing protein (putative c-di-GMP-specific phosphodiesterase class I)
MGRVDAPVGFDTADGCPMVQVEVTRLGRDGASRADRSEDEPAAGPVPPLDLALHSEVQPPLREADVTGYRAKQLGDSRIESLDERGDLVVAERLDAQDSVCRAVERMELVLHYEPQIELRSGQVVGAEALVRWDHPGQDMLLPERIIPIGEEGGLVVDLGSWVLRQACADAAEWANGGRPLRVSVKLSERQVAQEGIVADVAAALSETGLPAPQLCLEVTETVLMEETGPLVTTLRELADLGVGLSIDDFGMGYAALSYLKRMPVNELKIDGSFVKGLGVDAADEAIVAHVIGIGGALGLDVVAEGVETDQQAARLIDLGCKRAQGYLFDVAPASGSPYEQSSGRSSVKVVPEPDRTILLEATEHDGEPPGTDSGAAVELLNQLLPGAPERVAVASSATDELLTDGETRAALELLNQLLPGAPKHLVGATSQTDELLTDPEHGAYWARIFAQSVSTDVLAS